jgi:hypothetical protein
LFNLRLGLPSGVIPSGFPTKTLCVPFLSAIHVTCPSHLLRVSDHPSGAWWGVQTMELLMLLFSPVLSSFLLVSYIFLST